MKLKTIFGIFYLLLAGYLANEGLNFFKKPDFLLGIDLWVYVISAVIIGILGIKSFFKKEHVNLGF